MASVQWQVFDGKLKLNKVRSYEITGVILDLAVRFGRLRPARRPEWEAWVDSVYAVANTWGYDSDPADYRSRLMAAAGQPLPSD